MPSASPPPPLAPEVRSVLSSLRWRIRAYVWLEGLALAVIWVGVMFWAVLALDYLPILVGASEMPQAVRAVLLVVMLGGLAYVAYRWILARAFVRLGDRSMALLLERRFQNFRDALVTSVELSERPEHAAEFNPQMLSHTNRDAIASVQDVRVGEVFRFAPLLGKLATAVALVLSLLLFASANIDVFRQAAQRIWLLDSQPWPRSAKIEVIGIELLRAASSSGQSVGGTLLTFENGRVKVAKGASVNLKVRADAAAKVVPEFCTIAYRTAEGDRGSAQMKRIGRPKEEEIDGQTRNVQNYAFDGKPFKGILSTLRFDVIGFDHRQSGYEIEVVDSPAIVETKLACEFPEYMVDPSTSSWLPRTVDYLATGTQLPRGTKIVLQARSNKDLRAVQIYNPDSGEAVTLPIAGDQRRRFEFPIDGLKNNLNLEITLQDVDNVASDRPQKIYVAVVPDEAPRVDVKLKGIGSSVTPDVVIPVRGKIVDDYAVDKSWFNLLVNDSEPRDEPFPLASRGDVAVEFDFRESRARTGGVALQPKDKLHLRILAADRCQLDSGPNVGGGDQYQFDVVTPGELLALLEARELSHRQRFEQVIAELTEMRDSLLRVKVGEPNAAVEPTEPKKPAAGADEAAEEARAAAERTRTLRLLRVQRAAQQSQKSSQETLGVALAFAEIREEIINNRIPDSTDRQERLQNQIADPLKAIVAEKFPGLDQQLADLEKILDDPKSVAAADLAVKKTDEILLQLNDVLQKMLDLETYNELLDIVRDLIKEQQELIEKTKKQKKQQLLDLTK